MSRALPHSRLLGLLLFAGVVAFATMWSLFALVVFLSLRS